MAFSHLYPCAKGRRDNKMGDGENVDAQLLTPPADK